MRPHTFYMSEQHEVLHPIRSALLASPMTILLRQKFGTRATVRLELFFTFPM